MSDGGPSEKAKLREIFAAAIVMGQYANPNEEPYPADDVLNKADWFAIEAMKRREYDRQNAERTNAEPEEEPLTCGVVVDLLGLVDRIVPLNVVETWTEAQRETAAGWAGALHGLASDNDVDVPPEPEWTKPFEVDFKGRYVRHAALQAGAEAMEGEYSGRELPI